MAYDNTLREEEIKNKLRKDYFQEYDATPVLGDVDFAVAIPTRGPQLFETEFLLWAEAKKGTHHDIKESLVQLILTIGKARTYDRYMPPRYLGAFDAEKIAFIPYDCVVEVFGQNDFNWNVKPSDHQTKEFQQLQNLVSDSINRRLLRFIYGRDDKELRKFIKNFFRYDCNTTKIRISKSNFIHIFQKWLIEVKPTIVIDWEAAKRGGIYEGDFYLADILSKDDCTLREKLNVLLRTDKYILDRCIDDTGLENQKIAYFMDDGCAHRQFWNRYRRPPKREYWEYIVSRQDLLVSQDVRERKGSFFTPQQWVELSQQYLADELGENWQDEYYIWDCAAGTGNLLVGLTNKYNIWASTIDKRDVDAMHDRIQNGANLLDRHVFQFDFLNDPFTKLPQELQDIINNEEKRKKLVIYINPPYAEAASKHTLTGTGHNKTNVAVTNLMYKKYIDRIGIAGREVFAQFYIRIYNEIPSSVLAVFTTFKTLQAPNFTDFREQFRAKLGRIFCVPANTFDNVNGNFPIGFFIWNLAQKEVFTHITSDVYDAKGEYIGTKTIEIERNTKTINDWIIKTRKRPNERTIGYMSAKGNDFQNANYNFIINTKTQLPHPRGTTITDKNLCEIAVYYAVRHCIEATWLNDRDQFLYPHKKWEDDKEFQADCLAYTLFNNNIQSQYGVNYWIPFTEDEVDAKDCFESHFMSDYIHGRTQPSDTQVKIMQGDLFEPSTIKTTDVHNFSSHFSIEAQAVMDAGRELWRYYHAQPTANPNASFYDIRLHFQGTKTMKNGKVQMNPDSQDARYTQLILSLRRCLKTLARRIEPKVYEYGFLKK
ncbi:MAG: hypothetical protein IJS97_02255 [Prevotella sp.]|nr:hypothetical protein [Prevotella sp.]